MVNLQLLHEPFFTFIYFLSWPMGKMRDFTASLLFSNSRFPKTPKSERNDFELRYPLNCRLYATFMINLSQTQI